MSPPHPLTPQPLPGNRGDRLTVGATDVIRSVLRIAIVALCLAPAALALLEGKGIPRASLFQAAAPEVKGDAFPEYEIKAAFLFNFIRYTSWPEKALGGMNEPIEILVVGKNPFGTTLRETFRGKELHGRRVIIKHAEHPPKDITAALVFVSGLAKKDEGALIKECTGKPILLIGDQKGFGERGACANFFVERNKVRFQVNTEVTKKSKLTISSQLLKLAKIVKTERRNP